MPSTRTELRAVQTDVVEHIKASRARAEKHSRFRAVWRHTTAHALKHWELQERKVWLRWFTHWEPIAILETKAEAQELVDQLEHASIIWPRD